MVKRTTRARHGRVQLLPQFLQTKIMTNVETFNLTANLNAVSGNLSSLLSVFVQNEVTVMHKYHLLKFRLSGDFFASPSYEHHARKFYR